MKTIVLLLDGLGDIPHQALEGKTPLEAAHTPHLDALCRQAETGMMVPWKLSVPMGTEVAHFVLLGYDINAFPGRGIVEALSRNVPLEKEGVYVATTWSTVAESTGAYNSSLSIKERWTSDLTEEEIKKNTGSAARRNRRHNLFLDTFFRTPWGSAPEGSGNQCSHF